MEWRGRTFSFQFPRPPLVMGILNVTPDSFSDGGLHFEVSSAVERACQMVEQGASLIDIGGESTRPGAEPSTIQVELNRILPVMQQLTGRLRVPISVDTRKPEVARMVLEAGAGIINDIEASQQPRDMWKVVAEFNAGYVAMHMQGTPATMQIQPYYTDLHRTIDTFFTSTVVGMESFGVARCQVALDPGIGFGKTARHNLQLIAGAGRYISHGRPIVVGLSRKSFLGTIVGGEIPERLPAAIAGTLFAIHQGVSVIRTHDVQATVRALRMWEALVEVSREPS